MKVLFYEFDEIQQDCLKFAVMITEFQGKWMFVRHKERTTWEIPGGRREAGEDILETARRELYEETGAKTYDIDPVCVYCVRKEEHDTTQYTDSFGALYHVKLFEQGALPAMEIAETALFDSLPEQLTYAAIQPDLFRRMLQYKAGASR